MLVKDIIEDSAQILGFCERTRLYGRLTYAIEVLANKGNWNPLLGYADITAVGNVVTLPREIEVPIKVNINNNPSFTRDRLYEFSLNGPSTDMVDAGGYSWMDKGTVPTLVALSTPSLLRADTASASDNGKFIRIYGKDSGGAEISDTLTLNSASPAVTANTYASIDRVSKDATIGTVAIKMSPSATLLSTYYPDETEPQYRQIRLTKSGAAVRMLFRRKTFKIASDDDFIPLHSQMAVLLMLKALEKYRNEDFDTAAKLEAKAVEMAKDEQESLMGFDIAKNSENATALDLSYNNKDSIIVADIYDDTCALLGPVGQRKVFDFITEAVEALSNKSTAWDGMDGYVDITTDQYHYLTLPRYVETPIAINIGGAPTVPRNRWFEFHLNGPGSECCGSCGTWDDAGDVVTIRDVAFPQQLIATTDTLADVGKTLKIYGTYQGNRVTETVNGVQVYGYTVTVASTGALPATNAPIVDTIERITKDSSNNFITLTGYSIDRNSQNPIGYYYPDETEPNYRRIRIPQACAWVRLRYRKRTRKVTSLTDPLHLKSKLAVMTMMRAMFALGKGDVGASDNLEKKAVQYLSEEQMTRNPTDTFSFQFSTATHMADPHQGII